MSSRRRTQTTGAVRRGKINSKVGPAAASAAGPSTGSGGGTVDLSDYVEGPASAVSGRLAAFSGTSGKVIADSGATPASIIAAAVDAVLPVNLASALDVTGRLPLANLVQLAALSVLGVTGNALADAAAIVAGTDGQVLRRSGTALAFGALDLAAAAAIAGKLPLANLVDATATKRILARKTAAAGVWEEVTISELLDFVTTAAQGALLMRGASAWGLLAPGTAGQVLTAAGAGVDLAWATPAAGGGGGGGFDIGQHMIFFQAGMNSSAQPDIVVIGDNRPAQSGWNTPTWFNHANNRFVKIASAATVGSPAGWTANAGVGVQTQWSPILELIVLPPDVLTSVRCWVGLTASQFTDSDTIATNSVAFRFSSVAGDAGWTPVCRAAGSQTVGTTIGTVVATTPYRLKIRITASTIYFSVNGGTEQGLMTNLPTNTTDVFTMQRAFAQATSARNVGFCRGTLKWGVAVP